MLSTRMSILGKWGSGFTLLELTGFFLFTNYLNF